MNHLLRTIALCLLSAILSTSLLAATAAELLQKGETNLRLGKLVTADQAFRDALRAARTVKDRKREAAARNGIARVFTANRWEALGNLQLALAIHRELKDAKGEASDLARMGEINFLHGYHRKAVAQLTEAASLQERLGLVEERAATLEHLGVVLHSTGAYEEAAAHLATAVELRRRDPDPTFELVRVEVRLATLQTILGLDESAAAHLQAAKQTIQQFRAQVPPKRWEAMRKAWVKHGQRFTKDMGPMAMKLAETMDDTIMNVSTDDAELLDLIAPDIERLGRGQGLPDDAPQFPDFSAGATKGSEGAAASEGAKLSRRTSAAGFLAMVNQASRWMLGQMENVRADLLREFPPEDVVLAEKIWATQPCEMEIENNLQHILQLMGNHDEAKASNALAWKLMDAQDEQFSRVTGVAPAEGVAEQRRAARRLGLPIPPFFANACDGVLNTARTTLWDADVAAAQGKTDEAIRGYTTAAGGGPVARATALTRIAFLHEQRKDKQKAAEAYAQAIDAVEAMQGRLRLDELVASWAGQQAPLYARAIALQQESGRPEIAFAYAERARARAFLNQMGNRRLPAAVPPQLAAELHEVRGKLIALEIEKAPPAPALPLPNAMAAMGGGDPRAFEREQLRKRYAELLGRLAQSNPGYLSLVQVETVSLAKLQREVLPADTTLIEYFVLNDRTMAWVIDRENVRAVELKVAADDLNGRVGYFVNLIKGRKPEARNAAEELYETLFAPLQPLVRHPNLIIVPHASLHYLPFAALRNGKQNRYLVEDYAISTVPSASALRFMKASGRRSNSLLALGDPDRTLPHAEAEVRSIAKMYGGSPRVGKDASERRLRADVRGAGFLHVAAHASYDQARPLFSHIDLAPAGDGEPADGRLHVYEVYDLDLGSTRLAVLSACETALGPRSNGDDLVALTRAFLAAGAPAVMTTLWAVNDAPTSELVVQFYERLCKGAPPAKALQQAQIAMLARDPKDWSSFVLTGDGR